MELDKKVGAYIVKFISTCFIFDNLIGDISQEPWNVRWFYATF